VKVPVAVPVPPGHRQPRGGCAPNRHLTVTVTVTVLVALSWVPSVLIYRRYRCIASTLQLDRSGL